MTDSSQVIKLPTITPSEIAQAATASAAHAKELFLRGMPAYAVDAAHHAAELAAEIGHEAELPLRDLVAWFRKFLPKPAPAPIPEPRVPPQNSASAPSTIAQTDEPRATADVPSGTAEASKTEASAGQAEDAQAQPG